MKKRYIAPKMVCERFVANEYISSCTDTVNEYYKFVCDAGEGAHADIYEGAYPGGKNLTSDSVFSKRYFHACNIEHYVEKNATYPFVSGWYDENSGNGTEYKFDVVIWKGLEGDDVHATRSLEEDIAIVEGNKS